MAPRTPAKFLRMAVLGALLLAAAPATAAGQMRPGQPEVLAQPRREPVQIATPWQSLQGRFAGRNRVMLFWQAEFDDGVATRYREVETSDLRAHGVAARVDGVAATWSGPAGVTVAGGEGHVHQRNERYVAADGGPAARARGDDRRMESTFVGELRLGGLRFIDRTLALRRAGIEVEGERPNLQSLETRALVGHADYLMQVNAIPANASGRLFHVLVLDVASGEALLDFHTSGEPPAGPQRGYVATDDGFARGQAAAAGDDEIARQLALETGRRMLSMPRRR